MDYPTHSGYTVFTILDWMEYEFILNTAKMRLSTTKSFLILADTTKSYI